MKRKAPYNRVEGSPDYPDACSAHTNLRKRVVLIPFENRFIKAIIPRGHTQPSLT